MMSNNERNRLLRDMHTSEGARFGTSAPYAIESGIVIEKVGFGDVPLAYVMIACRYEHTSALVPIARQYVFEWLQEQGILNDVVEFTPGVARQRERHRFMDANEASPTCGRYRYGALSRFGFEIKAAGITYFAWTGRRGKAKPDPLGLGAPQAQ